MNGKSGNIGLRLNLLYGSRVAWLSRLISYVSLANTCRGNDVEHYGHTTGIAVSHTVLVGGGKRPTFNRAMFGHRSVGGLLGSSLPPF